MRFPFRFLFALLVALASVPCLAALGNPDPAPAAPVVQADPLGRETPRSAVSGLIKALAESDYDRAAMYFDLPPASSGRQRMNAVNQARTLHALLDGGGTIKPFAALSNDVTGSPEDELPMEQEAIGEIAIQGKQVPILLTRGPEGTLTVWRVSKETLQQVAAASARMPAPQQQDAAGTDVLLGGAPLTDWAILLGLGVLIFGGLWLLSALIVAAMRRVVTDPPANGLYRSVEAALPPASLLLAVGIFYNWADSLPVSIVARQTLLRYAGIVAVVAVVWFGLRLVDAIAELATTRMRRAGRRQIVSVITLVRRAVKVLLLVFSGIGILDTFGIDVTTGIAALGIGGIALALGAQKTVENLVGSVTVIADRPMQVGDFIKVGDVVGTVEDVGIRSTRIRTGERTVVTIPNGDLSARQIENFAERDRFLFNPVIAVASDTPSAKLKEAIGIVQQVLADEPKLAPGARARLGNIGDRAFNIEVFCYIDVRDFETQVIIREALLLALYERLEAAGIALSFRGQALFLAREEAAQAPTAHGSARVRVAQAPR